MVHYNRKPPRGNFGELACIEESLEKQDPPRIMALAQRYRSVELDQGETIGITQRRQHAPQSVAVRIGLDDGEHLSASSPLAGLGKILAQRRKIDLRNERTGHGGGGSGAAQDAPGPCGFGLGEENVV